MADLYTSQVHLKRLLAGQAAPVFTSPPEAILKVLDPAFFPGMGALNEDEFHRLQCPVRGCGTWHTSLGQHLTQKHRAIGGMNAVRSALDIPKSTALYSALVRAKHPRPMEGRRRSAAHQEKMNAAAAASPRKGKHGTSIARRNFANTCPAQLQYAIEALQKKLLHSPTRSEFADEYGYATLSAVIRVFGTWANAKAVCGLATNSAGRHPATVGMVVESLRVWVAVHGDLPTVKDADLGERVPRIPTHGTIMRAFGVDNWPAAMRSAVEHLGIKSERYGSSSRRAS